MYHRIRLLGLVFCLVVSVLASVSAQPVLSTKRTLFGYNIFQDYKNKRLFYYSPPDIVLKKSSDDSPQFTLLQMRYTGTHLYSDKDFKGFLNILQLSVNMETITSDAFGKIKQALGRYADLRPLPIRKFNGELIIPIGDAAAANEKYRKVSANGVDAVGEPTGNTFWSERTFTIRLENHESQLLWNQVETGKLGISFSYSFYADAIPGVVGDMRYSGTRREFVEGMEEELPPGPVYDSTTNTYLVKANTFPIYINVEQYPQCLKKIDINEELPPAYASFEVRCYDFSDDLRPDLFKKIVEIKAFGAAKEFITIKADFSKNKSDLSSQTARFPYAVRLDQPLEYRITEINVNGERQTSQWMLRNNWTEVIDVTTPERQSNIAKKSLDVEVDLDSLAAAGYKVLLCQVEYVLNQKSIQQELSWEMGDEASLKNIALIYDSNQPIRYRLIYQPESGEAQITKFKTIPEGEGYLYLGTEKKN